MTDELYQFYIRIPGQSPKWYGSRRIRSGTLDDYIKDLQKKYIVTRKRNQILLSRLQ